MQRRIPRFTSVPRPVPVLMAALAAAVLTLGSMAWVPQIGQAKEVTYSPVADDGSAASPLTASSSPRVGIQVGHWKNADLPAELSSLKGSTGAEGQGWREVDVNLDIAQRVVALLQQANVSTDLIPATVPPDYKADAFVALHCDANDDKGISGYKLARATWSSIPARDDALLNAISAAYGAATGLPYHYKTITPAMRMYYAFNQRLQHSVDPSTPAVILEMGFLSNAADRQLLMKQQDVAARAIADGILAALGRQ